MEQVHHLQVPLGGFGRPGIRQEAGGTRVLLDEIVAQQRALAVSFRKLVDLLLQLGAVLPNQPAYVAALVDGHLLVHAQVRQDLAPEEGGVAIHDGDTDQAGIDHLQQIVIRKVLRRRLELDRRLALARKPCVELLQVTPITGGPPHHDILAREVVEGAHHGRLRPCDHQLLDAAEERPAPVHLGHALGGQREDAGGHVTAACQEVGDERVA